MGPTFAIIAVLEFIGFVAWILAYTFNVEWVNDHPLYLDLLKYGAVLIASFLAGYGTDRRQS